MSHTLKPQRAQEPVSARTGPTDIGTVPARAAAITKGKQCGRCGAPCGEWSKVCRECYESDGQQEKVLSAVREGMRTVDDIRLLTKLDENATRTAIRRLQDSGRIRRLNLGGYAPVDTGFLLAHCWRGIPREQPDA